MNAFLFLRTENSEDFFFLYEEFPALEPALARNKLAEDDASPFSPPAAVRPPRDPAGEPTATPVPSRGFSVACRE